MLTDIVETGDAVPYARVPIQPGAADMKKLGEMLAAAKKPVAIVGGGGWSDQARKDFEAFCRRRRTCRSAASFRCQDFHRQRSSLLRRPCRCRHQPEARRVHQGQRSAAGGRRPARRDDDPGLYPDRYSGAEAEAGARLFRSERDRPHLSARHSASSRVRMRSPPPPRRFPPRARSGRSGSPTRMPSSSPIRSRLKTPGAVQMADVVAWLRQRLPADAIVCNGAGNYATFVHRFWQLSDEPHRSCADLAARWATACRRRWRPRRVHPDRPVVAFAGDGCFMMTGQEFATAVQHDLPVIVHRQQQRHVRHHPHAPGARASRPHLRHRAEESGLRRPRRAPMVVSAPR